MLHVANANNMNQCIMYVGNVLQCVHIIVRQRMFIKIILTINVSEYC